MSDFNIRCTLEVPAVRCRGSAGMVRIPPHPSLFHSPLHDDRTPQRTETATSALDIGSHRDQFFFFFPVGERVNVLFRRQAGITDGAQPPS